MKMPFGKYKGTGVWGCPYNYIKWLCSQDWLKGELRKECERYVNSMESRASYYSQFEEEGYHPSEEFGIWECDLFT